MYRVARLNAVTGSTSVLPFHMLGHLCHFDNRDRAVEHRVDGEATAGSAPVRDPVVGRAQDYEYEQSSVDRALQQIVAFVKEAHNSGLGRAETEDLPTPGFNVDSQAVRPLLSRPNSSFIYSFLKPTTGHL